MASDDDELPQKLDLRNLRVHEQLLGESSSASFWSASWSGQEITLKVLNPKPKVGKAGAVTDGSSTPSAEEGLRDRMFLREAKLCMQLENRHIVRCFGVAQLPGGFVPNQTAPALACAMERCEPQTIKDLITRGMAAGRRAYKANEAFKWLIQVSAALSYLHGQKPPIIHRDIRADSILLQRTAAGGEMACKLSDFGLHAVLYDDRSNALRRRAFTQTIFNPLADGSTAGGGGGGEGGGDDDVSQSGGSKAEMASCRAADGGAGGGSRVPPAANGASPPSGPGRPSPGTGTGTGTGGGGGSGGGGGGHNAGAPSPKPSPDKQPCGGQADTLGPRSAPAPAAGLGDVASLLKQLGISELQPLQPQEMERVYSWPEKAESFLYMAPEVFNNLPCNERSDVFSFGVLAYELLAGELLSISIFNTGRAARMGVHDRPGYAGKVAQGHRPARTQAVSDAAWSLIESCWHPDPLQRPTMALVQEQLQKLAAELEGGGGAASPVAAVSPKGAGGKAAAAAASPASGVAAAGAKLPLREPVDGPSPGCTQQCVIS